MQADKEATMSTHTNGVLTGQRPIALVTDASSGIRRG